MAKKIIWSKTAKTSKKDILLYWNERNKSKRFSKKLNTLIHDAVKFIGDFPASGKLTSTKECPDQNCSNLPDILCYQS